jgi:hypothetical protein
LNELHDETEENCPDCENTAEPFAISLLTPCYVPGPTDISTSEKVKFNYISRYACTRASPLVCPNQTLITEFGVLRLSRELEGKDINALAYARAIAVRSGCSELVPRRLGLKVLYCAGYQRSDSTNLSDSTFSDLSEIAYPFRITSGNFETEVSKLPFLGGKITSKVQLSYK